MNAREAAHLIRRADQDAKWKAADARAKALGGGMAFYDGPNGYTGGIVLSPEQAEVALPKLKRSERAIQAEILRLLHARGIVAYGMNRERAGYRRANHIGVKGLADISGWIPATCPIAHATFYRPPHDPLPLFIEVKRPGGKLTSEQAAFLRRAQADHCIAFMATSPADVAKALGL